MNLNHIISEFEAHCEKISAYGMACGLFSWDMSTGAPKGGNASRAKVMSIIGAEAFAMSISDQMKNYIDQLEANKDRLDETTLAKLRICKRDYESYKKIPIEDMKKYTELVANASDVWEKAKGKNDYASFAPILDEIMQYKIRFVNYRGFESHPYNTLLDDHEPGMTTEKLDAFFAKLKSTIVPLLKKINEKGKKIDTSFVNRPVSKQKQEKIAAMLMDKVGYNLNHGMLRESEHPFSISFGKTDARITTNYHENMFLSSFFSVMHECGHAIYEQNKMNKIQDTILDNGISMGIHESQSRFFENVIGRSYEFWETIYDELMSILGDDFKDITLMQFYEAVNVATPSLIRIEADELTYSLHIMVRYEMEKFLLTGDYDISLLPRMWNEKMSEYLGVTPANDTQGILQDVHWSSGLVGYFPSYSLGNAYAAQLLHYMKQDLDVYDCIKKGNIIAIREWLADKIHKYGSIKTPEELVKSIAGEDLNADYYVQYLEDKYSKIYGL